MQKSGFASKLRYAKETPGEDAPSNAADRPMHPTRLQEKNDFAHDARAEAVIAYEAYREHAKRRNLKGVLQYMTARYRVPMLALSRQADFWPFFDLWCDDTSRSVVIESCSTKGDIACLNVLDQKTRSRVELKYRDGEWRVDSEQCVVRCQASPLPAAMRPTIIDRDARGPMRIKDCSQVGGGTP
jgi:hypothetical protein